ncbi:hypothetical protein DFH09DRAFT_1287603 [Mycena vulgaris]|nr:hypothetical protein DFH09DRAFT_1287603 [Mycena vulgaris]
MWPGMTQNRWGVLSDLMAARSLSDREVFVAGRLAVTYFFSMGGRQGEIIMSSSQQDLANILDLGYLKLAEQRRGTASHVSWVEMDFSDVRSGPRTGVIHCGGLGEHGGSAVRECVDEAAFGWIRCPGEDCGARFVNGKGGGVEVARQPRTIGIGVNRESSEARVCACLAGYRGLVVSVSIFSRPPPLFDMPHPPRLRLESVLAPHAAMRCISIAHPRKPGPRESSGEGALSVLNCSCPDDSADARVQNVLRQMPPWTSTLSSCLVNDVYGACAHAAYMSPHRPILARDAASSPRRCKPHTHPAAVHVHMPSLCRIAGHEDEGALRPRRAPPAPRVRALDLAPPQEEFLTPRSTTVIGTPPAHPVLGRRGPPVPPHPAAAPPSKGSTPPRASPRGARVALRPLRSACPFRILASLAQHPRRRPCSASGHTTASTPPPPRPAFASRTQPPQPPHPRFRVAPPPPASRAQLSSRPAFHIPPPHRRAQRTTANVPGARRVRPLRRVHSPFHARYPTRIARILALRAEEDAGRGGAAMKRGGKEERGEVWRRRRDAVKRTRRVGGEGGRGGLDLPRGGRGGGRSARVQGRGAAWSSAGLEISGRRAGRASKHGGQLQSARFTLLVFPRRRRFFVAGCALGFVVILASLIEKRVSHIARLQVDMTRKCTAIVARRCQGASISRISLPGAYCPYSYDATNLPFLPSPSAHFRQCPPNLSRAREGHFGTIDAADVRSVPAISRTKVRGETILQVPSERSDSAKHPLLAFLAFILLPAGFTSPTGGCMPRVHVPLVQRRPQLSSVTPFTPGARVGSRYAARAFGVAPRGIQTPNKEQWMMGLVSSEFSMWADI